MKIVSECALCRLGLLTKAPLCAGRQTPMSCAFMRGLKNLNLITKELSS